MPQKGYAGYALDTSSRKKLVDKFPPRFSKLIAHHITTSYGVTADAIPPAANAYVVGYASADGIETLIVKINGSTKRVDGADLHITWSLDPSKRKPVDSNKVIRNGWTAVSPLRIRVTPQFFPFNNQKENK